MAEGILGLGSSGSTNLNQDLIDRLKNAEEKARVEPFTNDLENWDLELEKIAEIESLVATLQSAAENFDLFSSTNNLFEQVNANTSGDAAVFDAFDVSGLQEGTTSITINQLAQRDVYQSGKFADKDALINGGQDTGDKLSVIIAGETLEFSTEGKTYADLAEEMNLNEKLLVSVEQVSGTESRLVIKSAETGVDNALNIIQNNVDLGFGDGTTKTLINQNTDPSNVAANLTGIIINGDRLDSFANGADTTYSELVNIINNYTEGGVQQYQASLSYDAITKEFDFNIKNLNGSNVTIEEIGSGDGVDFIHSSHVSVGQNLNAVIDGIDYDVASNSLTIQGNLTMTAVEIGNSTISIQKDNLQILPGLQSIVSAYNALNDYINDEIFDADSPIEDSGSLRTMMANIKDTIFGSYGEDGDLSLFNYGLSTDLNGYLTLDSTTFANALSSDPDGIKELLVGTAENKGLGTILSEYVDDLDGFGGLLTLYGENMADRKTALEEERDQAQEDLDSKYALMAEQFASYTAIITQLEASFSGLKLMIEQSTSGN